MPLPAVLGGHLVQCFGIQTILVTPAAGRITDDPRIPGQATEVGPMAADPLRELLCRFTPGHQVSRMIRTRSGPRATRSIQKSCPEGFSTLTEHSLRCGLSLKMLSSSSTNSSRRIGFLLLTFSFPSQRDMLVALPPIFIVVIEFPGGHVGDMDQLLVRPASVYPGV